MNHPVMIPKKSKINYWMISTLVLTVGLVLVSLYVFNLKSNLVEKNNQQPIEISDAPEENALYLGTLNRVDAIFVTNKDKQRYMGELRPVEGPGNNSFDFDQLANRKKIFSSDKEITSVEDLRFNNPKSVVYVALIDGTWPLLTSRVIQIKLDDLSANEVWSGEIPLVREGKYDGARGNASINIVAEDKYMALDLYSCYGCEARRAGIVVLNLNTKQEKYYKEIGNIQFDLPNNTFSYQKLVPFKEPCTSGIGGLGCDDDGQETFYKPSGQVFSESLP